MSNVTEREQELEDVITEALNLLEDGKNKKAKDLLEKSNDKTNRRYERMFK